MLRLKRANIVQILKLNKIIHTSSKNIELLNFYSEFKDNSISYIIQRDAYFIMEDQKYSGALFIDKCDKVIYFIPLDKSISIFQLIHLLNRNFPTKGYKLTLNYKKINTDNLLKYFNVSISENMMYMSIENRVKSAQFTDQSLLVRNMLINKEEATRVDLQNKIFSNIANRCPLTLDEVLIEQENSRFLKDFCFILEVYREPVGYGQILKFNSKYFLVNFGIISEYRNKGYGHYFLDSILRECSKAGIKEVSLSVDKYNSNAVNLYSKMGFREIYNMLTITFK